MVTEEKIASAKIWTLYAKNISDGNWVSDCHAVFGQTLD